MAKRIECLLDPADRLRDLVLPQHLVIESPGGQRVVRTARERDLPPVGPRDHAILTFGAPGESTSQILSGTT